MKIIKLLKLAIIHITRYDFVEDVFIEPHFLRFVPRVNPLTELRKSVMDVMPLPCGLVMQRDVENNNSHFCWFKGMHSSLNIISKSILEIQEYNPYDFLIFPGEYAKIPFQYEQRLRILLTAALIPSTLSASLIAYGEDILNKTDFNTTAFLSELTSRIHQDFQLAIRIEGIPVDPDQTFIQKTGSCRDLAWMQIKLLRHFGIAARFVSGYFYLDSENSDHDLHGWLDVYLPGAGWIGYDPSNGIMTGSSHIAVSSSAFFEQTMPVTGTFRGDASGTMSTFLEVMKIE